MKAHRSTTKRDRVVDLRAPAAGSSDFAVEKRPEPGVQMAQHHHMSRWVYPVLAILAVWLATSPASLGYESAPSRFAPYQKVPHPRDRPAVGVGGRRAPRPTATTWWRRSSSPSPSWRWPSPPACSGTPTSPRARGSWWRLGCSRDPARRDGSATSSSARSHRAQPPSRAGPTIGTEAGTA